MDGLPLTGKVIYGRQTVIQGQGCFSKCGLPQVIPSVVLMGFVMMVKHMVIFVLENTRQIK